jgi:hypothetical protein
MGIQHREIDNLDRLPPGTAAPGRSAPWAWSWPRWDVVAVLVFGALAGIGVLWLLDPRFVYVLFGIGAAGLFIRLVLFTTQPGGWRVATRSMLHAPAQPIVEQLIDVHRTFAATVPGPAQLTYAPHIQPARAPENGAQRALEAIIEAVPAAPALPASLADILARGLATPERYYVGQGADGTPQQIIRKHAGFIGVGGVQGTGKTNTATLLAAQTAVHDGLIYLADPQAGDEESLTTRLEPMSGAVARVASLPDEINALIGVVDSIYQHRNANPKPEYRPVLLIIDEFMDLLIRQALTDDSIRTLQALAGVGRKKGINVVVIAQVWKLQLIGQQGVAIRQLVTHALLHRSQPETVKAFAIGGEYAKQIISMQPGQALFFGTGEPVVTTMPEMTHEDMQYAAQGKPARPPQLVTTPAQLAPTQRVSPPPSVPTQPMTMTNQELILDLLRGRPSLTSKEIAEATRIQIEVVWNELNDLTKQGKLYQQRNNKGGREKYRYSLLTHSPTEAQQPS